jgi:heptosyltransferase-2
MRIVAIKTHAAGDLLLTTPALRALQRRFPEADLLLLTGRANVDVAGAVPGVDAYMFVDEKVAFKPKLFSTYRLARDIKNSGADMVALFQPWPALARMLNWGGAAVYAPFAGAKPPRYLAGGAPWQPNADKYVAENYVEVVEAAGCTRDDLRLDFVIPRGVPKAAEITGIKKKKKYVALVPSGGTNPRESVEAKLPPAYFFAEIVDFIKKESGRPVVLVGGPQDQERCAAIAAKADGRDVVNLAGKADVFESARLIENSAYLITVDSLPLHIGVALQKPTLALFAPSNPAALLPRGGPAQAVAAELECAPCYANSPFPRCKRPFKYECRERIPLAAVKDFILKREKK